ncbi:ribonuclease H-like domain, reverse transcriptase, RNA-dependent DNA polymerase [Tanacetum coccineum]
MVESLSKFMAESTKRHEENSNLIKEIRASTDAAIRNQGASIKALEIQIGQICKVLTTLLDDVLPTKEKDPVSFTLPWLGELAPTKLIVELADRKVKRTKGIAENVLVRIDKFVFLIDFIVLDMPMDIKTSLILGKPLLSTSHAKIDMFKRKITLREGNDKVVFKSEKPTSNIIKRSLDPLYGDYIKLNDLNKPLEIKRNQVDDLEPTIKEGEVVDKPKMDIVKTRCYNEIVNGLDEYPSYYDFDRKIHIDCAYNLKFSCMKVEWNFTLRKNKENRRMILESVENGPLIWPTIEENRVIRTKTYAELSATEKIQADCDMKETNIIL